MPFTQNLYIQLPASTESRAKQASAVSDKFLISTKPLLKNPARIRQTGFPGKSNLPKNSAFFEPQFKRTAVFSKKHVPKALYTKYCFVVTPRKRASRTRASNITIINEDRSHFRSDMWPDVSVNSDGDMIIIKVRHESTVPSNSRSWKETCVSEANSQKSKNSAFGFVSASIQFEFTRISL